MGLGTWTHRGSANEAELQTLKVEQQKKTSTDLPLHRCPPQLAHCSGPPPLASHSLDQGGREGRVGFLRR